MKNEIISIVRNQFDRTTTTDKKFFIASLIGKLTNAGFSTEQRVSHPFLEGAKIDFKVTKANFVYWIELDNKTPRLRSVENIHELLVNGGQGIILLRNSYFAPYTKMGVDIISARR